MAEIGKDIGKARQLLEQSELVSIPTETVYGLAGNALDVRAVTRIFKVKNRPAFDPMIVHTYNLEEVQSFIRNIPRQAYLLARSFWPGPLTLLLPKKQNIPDIVTAGLTHVAVRVPDHPLTLDLLQRLDFPVAAPSANPFGYISPTTAKHVNDQLGDKIPYILDGGPCRVGIESTIIGFEGDFPVIYRLGGTSREEIEKVLGKVKVQPQAGSDPKAPGMLKSHYAPRKEIIIGNLEKLAGKYDPEHTAILSFKTGFTERERQVILSEKGDLDEAAQNFFSALRYLDTIPGKTILAEYVPDKGLGKAINDRLRRAAAK